MRLTASLALGAAIVLAAATPALADCKQWSIAGSQFLEQSNNVVVSAAFRQNGQIITGSAYYYSNQLSDKRELVYGTLNGSLIGNHLQLKVPWDTADAAEVQWHGNGVYDATVDSAGYVEGKNWDYQHPEKKFDFYVREPLICAETAPPPKIVMLSGAVTHVQNPPAAPSQNFTPLTAAVLPHPPSAGEPGGVAGVAPSMEGTFDTDLGVLVLTKTGGTYSTLNGRVAVANVYGNILDGTWSTSWSAQRCADGIYRGRLQFHFTPDGFTGAYGFCDGPLTAGAWNGKRR